MIDKDGKSEIDWIKEVVRVVKEGNTLLSQYPA